MRTKGTKARPVARESKAESPKGRTLGRAHNNLNARATSNVDKLPLDLESLYACAVDKLDIVLEIAQLELQTARSARTKPMKLMSTWLPTSTWPTPS